MFDVVAVNFKTKAVIILDTNKSEENADAIAMMAVVRRGVGTVFYSVVPTGTYKEGDTFNGE